MDGSMGVLCGLMAQDAAVEKRGELQMDWLRDQKYCHNCKAQLNKRKDRQCGAETEFQQGLNGQSAQTKSAE